MRYYPILKQNSKYGKQLPEYIANSDGLPARQLAGGERNKPPWAASSPRTSRRLRWRTPRRLASRHRSSLPSARRGRGAGGEGELNPRRQPPFLSLLAGLRGVAGVPGPTAGAADQNLLPLPGLKCERGEFQYLWLVLRAKSSRYLAEGFQGMALAVPPSAKPRPDTPESNAQLRHEALAAASGCGFRRGRAKGCGPVRGDEEHMVTRSNRQALVGRR